MNQLFTLCVLFIVIPLSDATVMRCTSSRPSVSCLNKSTYVSCKEYPPKSGNMIPNNQGKPSKCKKGHTCYGERIGGGNPCGPPPQSCRVLGDFPIKDFCAVYHSCTVNESDEEGSGASSSSSSSSSSEFKQAKHDNGLFKSVIRYCPDRQEFSRLTRKCLSIAIAGCSKNARTQLG